MGLLTRLLEQKHNTERDRVKFEFERDQSILTNPNSSEAQYQAALERMIDAAAPTPAHAKGMKAIFPKLLQRNLGSDPQTGQPYNRGMANASGVDSTTGDSVAWGPNGEITRTPRAGMGGQGQQQPQQQQQPSMRQQPQSGMPMPNSWDGGYSGLDGQPHTADGYRTPKPTDSTGINSTLPMGADGRPRLSNHGEYDGGVPPAAGIVPGVDDSGIGGTGIAQLAGNDLTASATTFNDRQPSVYGPFSLAGKATGSGSGSGDADTGEVDSSPAAGFDAGIGAGFVKNPAAAAQKKSTSDATAVTGDTGAGTDNSAARLPDPFSAYQGRNFEPSATSDDGHLLNVAKGSRPTIQKGPYNTPTDPFDAFKPGTTHGEDQVNQWWQMGGVPIDMSRDLPPVNTSKPPKKRMIPSGQSWKQEQPYSPQNLIGAGEGEDVNSLPRLAITQGGSDNRYRDYNGDTGRELPSLSGPGNGGWSKVYPSVMGKKAVDDFNKHVPSYPSSLPPLAQGNVASTQPASSGMPNAAPAPVPAPTTTPTPAPVTPKPVFPTATVAPKPVQPQAAPAAALSPQGGASAPVRHSPAPLPPQVPSVVPPTVPVGAPQTPVPGAEAQQQPGMNFPAGMTGSFPYGDPYETFDGVPGHPLSVNARIARQAMDLLGKGIATAQVNQFVMQQKIANLQRLRQQNPGLPESQLYAMAGIPIPGLAAAESRKWVANNKPVAQSDYVERADGSVGFNRGSGEFVDAPGTKLPVKNAPAITEGMMKWNVNLAAEVEEQNLIHKGEPGYPITAAQLTKAQQQQAQQPETAKLRGYRQEARMANPKANEQQISQIVVNRLKQEEAQKAKQQQLQIQVIQDRLDPLHLNGAFGSGSASEASNMPHPAQWRNEDFLHTLPLDVQQTVKGVAMYKLRPPILASRNLKSTNQFVGAVMTYNPQWTQAKYEAGQRSLVDFTSGKTSEQLRSLNTALGHAEQLYEASLKLKNGDNRAVNTIVNYVKTLTGDPRVTNYDTAMIALEGELSRVFTGVGATREEIAEWRSVFASNHAPQQLDGAIKQTARLLDSRINAFNQQWNNAQVASPEEMGVRILGPEGQAVMNNLHDQGWRNPPQHGAVLDMPRAIKYKTMAQGNSEMALQAATADGWTMPTGAGTGR